MNPEGRTPVTELGLLALDVETTGIRPGRDVLLAVGWVPVDGTRIRLGGARRFVVRHDDPGDAVTIHGLTHDDLDSGAPLAEVLSALREALAGRALLAHHAPFDLGFLATAHRAVGQHPLRVPVVCTLDLQRRLLTRGGGAIPKGALRLWTARARYGLPRVPAHDALGDALACAELYLAQVAELDVDGSLRLRDVCRRELWLHRVRRKLRRWLSASSR